MMDDSNNPYRQSFEEPIQSERPRSNVLAIVGFVLAFCLPPIGLLLSFIAVFRAPRAFAIAGLIVGLIGTVLLAILGWSMWLFAPIAVNGMDVLTDRQKIVQAVSGYSSANSGALPPDLATLQLPREYTVDGWGTNYRFTPQADQTWVFSSAGIDGQWDTADDLAFTSSMDENAAMQTLNDWMRARVEEKAGARKP